MYVQHKSYAHFLTSQAIREMRKTAKKFPQPNYVGVKFAEEAGEAVKEAVHLAEGRGDRDKLEAEAIQCLAMLFRLLCEGDQTIGLDGKPNA